MAEEIKKGDWINGRLKEKGTGEDQYETGGVVVGLPRKGNDGYYDVLQPATPETPIQIHPDGAEKVSDDQLTVTGKQFKEDINWHLNRVD